MYKIRITNNLLYIYFTCFVDEASFKQYLIRPRICSHKVIIPIKSVLKSFTYYFTEWIKVVFIQY